MEHGVRPTSNCNALHPFRSVEEGAVAEFCTMDVGRCTSSRGQALGLGSHRPVGELAGVSLLIQPGRVPSLYGTGVAALTAGTFGVGGRH